MPDLLPTLSVEDRQFLQGAAAYLEQPSFLIRVANLVGKPAESLLRLFPSAAHRYVAKATQTALERAFAWAVRTLPDAPARAGHENRAARFVAEHGHTTMAAATGAVGGMFGLAALPVEVPVTTMLMLRSIAQIARDTGADLSDPETRFQCLSVFSMGGGQLGAMESSYFTSRIALGIAIRDAAAFVAQHTAREIAQAGLQRSAPAIARLIGLIASRFEVTLTEKAAAQAVPVAGAALGALVNAAFTDHFNRVARFHFGILKLERRYGPDAVRAAYLDACAQGSIDE